MSDLTTLLFASPAFRVLEASLEPDGGRRVLAQSVAAEGCCPVCGVVLSRIKAARGGAGDLPLHVRKLGGGRQAPSAMNVAARCTSQPWVLR